MISHVNMNFHLQNKYRLQFWMKLYLAAWVARFGNIFLQILEFQSSDGVIQKVTGTLQSDILCFQNSVFPPWCFWNKWLWAWQEERQFCDFSWLIDRGRPNAKDINIAWSLGGLNWAVSWSQIALFLCRLASFLHHWVLRHFFPPFAAAVVRGDSQRHSWSNLKITFGSMLIIDSLIIFHSFLALVIFLLSKWDEMKYFGKLLSERFEILIPNICLPNKSLGSLTWNIW